MYIFQPATAPKFWPITCTLDRIPLRARPPPMLPSPLLTLSYTPPLLLPTSPLLPTILPLPTQPHYPTPLPLPSYRTSSRMKASSPHRRRNTNPSHRRFVRSSRNFLKDSASFVTLPATLSQTCQHSIRILLRSNPLAIIQKRAAKHSTKFILKNSFNQQNAI